MKKILLALSLVASSSFAQNDWFNAQIEMRGDYMYESLGSHKEATGFRGQYLNVKLNGNINDQFSYAYRQRFSKDPIREQEYKYWNATDYIFLSYHPNERWNISAGKQFVAIGGMEYDYAPIDVYRYSEYCNNINCYGFGMSVDYNLTSHDNLLVQAAQSAFAGHSSDFYSYNLLYRGNHGCYQAIHSVGMQEYAHGDYINVIALGNRFTYPFGHIDLDYTNRYAHCNNAKFLDDFTILGEAHFEPFKGFDLSAHYTFDRNKRNTADCTVTPGTELHTFGGTLQFFPIKDSRDVRLHASYCHTWGDNTNPVGTLRHDNNYLTVGLTWRLNVKKVKDYYQTKQSAK